MAVPFALFRIPDYTCFVHIKINGTLGKHAGTGMHECQLQQGLLLATGLFGYVTTPVYCGLCFFQPRSLLILFKADGLVREQSTGIFIVQTVGQGMYSKPILLKDIDGRWPCLSFCK